MQINNSLWNYYWYCSPFFLKRNEKSMPLLFCLLNTVSCFLMHVFCFSWNKILMHVYFWIFLSICYSSQPQIHLIGVAPVLACFVCISPLYRCYPIVFFLVYFDHWTHGTLYPYNCTLFSVGPWEILLQQSVTMKKALSSSQNYP